MKIFRVMGGGHVEEGKTYKKGELVSTERDLAGMFGEKFRLVSESPNPDSKIPLPKIPAPAEEKGKKEEAPVDVAEPAPPAENANDQPAPDVETRPVTRKKTRRKKKLVRKTL